MDSHLAQIVIQDEGPADPARDGRYWSLNLVVAGVPHRIGGLVAGHDVQDAAKAFAAAWNEGAL